MAPRREECEIINEIYNKSMTTDNNINDNH